MDDLISRQAAIDAILHNQEVYSNNFGNDPIDKYTIAIIDNDAQTIVQLPSVQPEHLHTADAVEIVRCRDCKHNPNDTWFECPISHLPYNEDRWCWKGERKDG